MAFFRKIGLGKQADMNRNGVPDHLETSVNDRNGNGILDHLEYIIDTNKDGLPDTQVFVQENPFSRMTGISTPGTFDLNRDGLPDAFVTDMDKDGIADQFDNFIDINHDGFLDIDFDID